MAVKKHSEETKEKIRLSLIRTFFKKGYDKLRADKISKAMRGNTNTKGTKRSKEFGELCRLNQLGSKNSMFGKKVSEKTRQKMRETRLELKKKQGYLLSQGTRKKLRILKLAYIQQQLNNGLPVMPTIGKYESLILDKQEKELGYKITRQYKVCGYFLDGYIPELNLAIEVDEEYHQRRKEKDLIREKEIKEELNCQFLRIEVKNGLSPS